MTLEYRQVSSLILKTTSHIEEYNIDLSRETSQQKR
jgi:hypothetical protein